MEARNSCSGHEEGMNHQKVSTTNEHEERPTGEAANGRPSDRPTDRPTERMLDETFPLDAATATATAARSHRDYQTRHE